MNSKSLSSQSNHVAAALLLATFFMATSLESSAQDPNSKKASPPSKYLIEKDLPYPVIDGSQPERCKIDLYYPENSPGFATVVWFHGGGLKAGKKSIPDALKEQGIAVAAANYRLHPEFKSPTYVQDAAAAVAWVIKNIDRFGGDPSKVFVSGHSAGGYLTSMIGLDKSYLQAHGVDADSLAGLIPYSGHTITHFTVRAERGINGKQPIVDSMAPLYHVRSQTPPILLITGDRELEMLGRYEENAYFYRMLLVNDNEHVTLHELDGFNHGSMSTPAHQLLLKFMRKTLAGKTAAAAAP